MKRVDLKAEALKALKRPATVYIRLCPPKHSDKFGYIGATIDYPAYPGENWRRGHDLPDGRWEPKTLNNITKAIKEEMKKLACTVEIPERREA